jgi:hypothetical protein
MFLYNTFSRLRALSVPRYKLKITTRDVYFKISDYLTFLDFCNAN